MVPYIFITYSPITWCRFMYSSVFSHPLQQRKGKPVHFRGGVPRGHNESIALLAVAGTDSTPLSGGNRSVFPGCRNSSRLVCAFGAEFEMIWIPGTLATPAFHWKENVNQNQMCEIPGLCVIWTIHTPLLSLRRDDWDLITSSFWWCC